MNRVVTERDFRMPEFRDADPNDYEIRDDGKIVRKDRWETGVRRIASRVSRSRLDPSSRFEWEVVDVINEVNRLADIHDRFIHLVTHMSTPHVITGGQVNTIEELYKFLDKDIELKREEDENS